MFVGWATSGSSYWLWGPQAVAYFLLYDGSMSVANKGFVNQTGTTLKLSIIILKANWDFWLVSTQVPVPLIILNTVTYIYLDKCTTLFSWILFLVMDRWGDLDLLKSPTITFVLMGQSGGSSYGTSLWWIHILVWSPPTLKTCHNKCAIGVFLNVAGFQVVFETWCRTSRVNRSGAKTVPCGRTSCPRDTVTWPDKLRLSRQVVCHTVVKRYV